MAQRLFVFVGPKGNIPGKVIHSIIAENLKEAKKFLRRKIEETFKRSPDGKIDRRWAMERAEATLKAQSSISSVPCRTGSFVEVMTDDNPANQFMNRATVGHIVLPKKKQTKKKIKKVHARKRWRKLSKEEIERMLK